jgi:hypothetical protein
MFYITVYGVFSSTYSLNIQAEMRNNTILKINDPVRGTIEKGEILNFIVLLHGPKQQVKVDIQSLVGNSDLLVRICGGGKYTRCSTS